MAAKKRSSKNASKGSRPSWQGYLTFGLVSFEVQAINALDRQQSDIHFHQLHAACGKRIRYAKMCPVHGEVDADEIVMGYEKSSGKYVEIDPEELKALKTDQARTITIDAFIAPDAIDPIFYDGRMYYLTPADPAAQVPYAVFVAAMERKQTFGIGEIILSGKQQLALLRADSGVMQMAMLNYEAEIKPPSDFQSKVSNLGGQAKQIRLAQTLIEELEDKNFDYSKYIDKNREKVEEVIAANANGEPDREEEKAPKERNVISLMEALEKSLKTKKGKTKATKGVSRSKGRASPKRTKAG